MSGSILRYGLFGLVIFLFLAIQTSAVIAVFDINPDFMLLCAILFSIYYGEFKGEIAGFILGFLVAFWQLEPVSTLKPLPASRAVGVPSK